MKNLNFVSKTLIAKGWSEDKKYCVTDKSGTRYLLRISPPNQYKKKKAEFQMMKQVASLDVPMCQPIEFGICQEGVYSLQSWIEGTAAEEIIPMLSDTEQYVYGLNAGQILKKIHSIPAPKQQIDWELRFNQKLDKKIQGYMDCPLKYEDGDCFLSYINTHRHLLKNRPQSYQHGDYHIGNMMIDKKKKLNIIDFNRNDYGDPWEEFNRIVWCVQSSPLFASGIVNGYFDNNVPEKFWELLALYIASNTLSSLYWATPFGQKEVEVMLHQAKDVIQWYDSMKNPIPTWYSKGYYLQSVDGLFYKLKSPFDFSFLSNYGKVFKIFDDQDSGNICFGIKKEEKRFFIKFAGAPTEQYSGDPKDAIARLKATVPVYQQLQHDNLIRLIKAEQIGNGFAMIFEWIDGECMGRMYPASRKKFMEMPLNTKLDVFHDILTFLEYTASKSYVAIDFYDGSILYDFEKKKTTICDIDFFHKLPYKNNMGRMWGSSRFQSPEEYELGAVLDEITNVYTIGATAFALFSNYDRTGEKWVLSNDLYTVALKAVNNDRTKRQQSIRQFIDEWEMAQGRLDI